MIKGRIQETEFRRQELARSERKATKIKEGVLSRYPILSFQAEQSGDPESGTPDS